MVVDGKSLREYKKKYNFFETPEKIADAMATWLDDLGRNAIVLEPSAGRGALVNAVRKVLRFDTQKIFFCELQCELAEGVEGAERVGEDFLEYTPGEIYDGIILNPPFTKGADIKHVEHAFECLKPGGKMVALVSKTGALYIDEAFEGHVFHRETFAKGFEDTAVETVMFLIHKPLAGGGLFEEPEEAEESEDRPLQEELF